MSGSITINAGGNISFTNASDFITDLQSVLDDNTNVTVTSISNETITFDSTIELGFSNASLNMSDTIKLKYNGSSHAIDVSDSDNLTLSGNFKLERGAAGSSIATGIYGNNVDNLTIDGEVSGTVDDNDSVGEDRMRLSDFTTAISITGDAIDRTNDVTIDDVEIINSTTDVIYRNSILISKGLAKFGSVSDVKISDVELTGNGTAHTGVAGGGTGDQINLVGVTGGELKRIKSLDGGENGITIGSGTSNINLSDITIDNAFGHGLQIGTAGYTITNGITNTIDAFLEQVDLGIISETFNDSGNLNAAPDNVTVGGSTLVGFSGITNRAYLDRAFVLRDTVDGGLALITASDGEDNLRVQKAFGPPLGDMLELIAIVSVPTYGTTLGGWRNVALDEIHAAYVDNELGDSEEFTYTINGSNYTYHVQDFWAGAGESRIALSGIEHLRTRNITVENADFSDNGRDRTGTRADIFLQHAENIDLDDSIGTSASSGVYDLYATSSTFVASTVRDTNSNILAIVSDVDGTFGDGARILTGNDGHNTLTGSSLDDEIQGGAGNDVLKGLGGNDTIFGHHDDDELRGGIGDDEIWGGVDNDILHGEAGNDSLQGNSGDDTLTGGLGDDEVYGGGDNDLLQGQGGSDTLYGQTGDDDIYGGAGDDILHGGAGDDTLYGGVGKSFADTLTGGTEADSFVFMENYGDDVVTDFVLGGVDTLLLDNALWTGTSSWEAHQSNGTASLKNMVNDFGSTNANGDVVLNFDHVSTTITLEGVGAAELANLYSDIDYF